MYVPSCDDYIIIPTGVGERKSISLYVSSKSHTFLPNPKLPEKAGLNDWPAPLHCHCGLRSGERVGMSGCGVVHRYLLLSLSLLPNATRESFQLVFVVHFNSDVQSAASSSSSCRPVTFSKKQPAHHAQSVPDKKQGGRS